MMSRSQLLVFSLVLFTWTAAAFTLPSCHSDSIASLRSVQLQERTRQTNRSHESSSKKRKCRACPEPNDDNMDMDRREAAFAMLGSLWAMSWSLPAAHAMYGEDAKMELPNIMDGMDKRINQQCLVETLGNRDCLVYLDPANKLYQQADNQVLLERIEKASEALATIPALIEQRKWSKVTGVLTGPLGTLVSTMGQLTKLSDNSAQAAELAKKVKGDIIEIGAAADKKQGDRAVQFHKKATDDLVAYVKSL